MAIFKIKESKEDKEYFDKNIIKIPKNGTIVSEFMKIEGSLTSNDSIVISGQIKGDIKCEEIVVILKKGSVKGKIEAKECRLDGKLEGNIEAFLVELSSGSEHKGNIFANSALIDGKLDGDILAKESLEIGKNGHIKTKICKAETIMTEGVIEGLIVASKLLDVKKGAKIKGEVLAKELNSDLGSQIEGNIKVYKLNKKLKEFL